MPKVFDSATRASMFSWLHPGISASWSYRKVHLRTHWWKIPMKKWATRKKSLWQSRKCHGKQGLYRIHHRRDRRWQLSQCMLLLSLTVMPASRHNHSSPKCTDRSTARDLRPGARMSGALKGRSPLAWSHLTSRIWWNRSGKAPVPKPTCWPVSS